MSVESLPLFPLQSVLVPGASMGLRIFERRYLDLVRDCGRGGHGFGICLILEGSETVGSEKSETRLVVAKNIAEEGVQSELRRLCDCCLQ